MRDAFRSIARVLRIYISIKFGRSISNFISKLLDFFRTVKEFFVKFT